MGCWNATCNVSNLPIFYGDKVVVIPLIKVKSDSEFNVCYATDVFVPFGMPLIGQYDDYGRIENIQTLDRNKNHLMQFNYFVEKNSGENGTYEPVEKEKGFDALVQRVLCSCGGFYIKTSNSALFHNGMAEINHMMIHYDLYRKLVEEVACRKPYGSEKTMYEHIKESTIAEIEKSREKSLKIQKMRKEISDESDGKLISLCEMMDFQNNLDLAEKIFSKWMLDPCRNMWSMWTPDLYADNNDELIEQIVERQLFTQALSCLRKGYLCDSGAGSQSEETKMHGILAKFILEQIEHNAKERYEDENDAQNGIEETFFV